MTAPLPTDDLDRQDMLRLAAGEETALDKLMERHARRLFHYLLRVVGNEEDADEIAQESFVRVYQHCGEFRTERRFSTWLYTIASNLARDCLRWRSRHPQTSLDAESSNFQEFHNRRPGAEADPRELLEIEERGRLVRQALGLLPEELRAPLMFAEYEGLSHAEIGAILDCTPKAVEMRIYRARHELRRQLAPIMAEA